MSVVADGADSDSRRVSLMMMSPRKEEFGKTIWAKTYFTSPLTFKIRDQKAKYSCDGCDDSRVRYFVTKRRFVAGLSANGTLNELLAAKKRIETVLVVSGAYADATLLNA